MLPVEIVGYKERDTQDARVEALATKNELDVDSARHFERTPGVENDKNTFCTYIKIPQNTMPDEYRYDGQNDQ